MNSDDDRDRLTKLLKRCTALVTVDGHPKGAAFFVSDRLLLTCEHVLGTGTSILVSPQGSQRRVTAERAAPCSTDPDLALLSIPPQDTDPDQPCVALDRELDDLDEADYCVAGFPAQQGLAPALRVVFMSGGPRDVNSTGSAQMLDLDPGKIITWGNSGGPVLNLRTGAVVAVVRMAQNPQDDLGAGAVPVSAAAKAFPEIDRLIDEPPVNVRQWRDILGKDRWAALRKPWILDARMDVEVSRTEDRKGWRIGLAPPIALSTEMVGSSLGADVGEAFFRWAKRRRIHDDEDTELVGSLLAGALFPTPVAERMSRFASADQVVVRLRFKGDDSDSDLVDTPWELSAVPGNTNRFLAADEQFRFLRVLDGKPPEVNPAKNVKVLSVVAWPTQWQYPTLYGRDGHYKWIETASIAALLRRDIEGNSTSSFQASVLVDPLPAGVKAALDRGLDGSPFTVFHFMGVGRTLVGRPQVALVSESYPHSDANRYPKWLSLQTILEWAVRDGAVLAVLEFLQPPVDSTDEPITPSALNKIIPDGLAGLVTTAFPVHPIQALEFNETFYEHLRAADSVETAVQLSRSGLQQNKPVEDATGFGWFSLVSRCNNEIRLLSGRPENPNAPVGVASPKRRTKSAGTTVGPRRPRRSKDAYLQ